MDEIIRLCDDSMQYPRNFASSYHSVEYLLDSYRVKLTEHQNQLFNSEAESAVQFYDFGDESKVFGRTTVKSARRLSSHLGTTSPSDKTDPKCRFLFLWAAGHSRARLRITREMLTLAFTYLQVMPEFLDFLFLFGRQATAEDLYCSGFRQRTRLMDSERGINAMERNWSGRDLQVCYSLKSVESLVTSKTWPWSIRHCAVQHTFDAETIRSAWIIIKGDDSMERRIHSSMTKSTTRPRSPAEPPPFSSVAEAFASSLSVHLILCDWSAENWRWYIKFLEEKSQKLTEGTTFVKADVPTSPTTISDMFGPVSRTNSHGTSQTNRSRFSNITRTFTRNKAIESIPLTGPKQNASMRMYENASGNMQPSPPGKTFRPSQDPTSPIEKSDIYGQPTFSFRDFQDIHDVEERANETVLILKLNLNVITQLRNYYKSIAESHELPEIIRNGCAGDLMRFNRRIDAITQDLELQLLRVEALLHLISDRKTLLYGLLEYRNTEANRILALESRQSTSNMEHMTRKLNIIARKTKTETVSMRVITLVTLFFLPGTFISTIMSTSIVNWDNGERNFQPEALKVYCYTTVTFMVLTFVFWYGMHRREKRKEKKQAEEDKENQMPGRTG